MTATGLLSLPASISAPGIVRQVGYNVRDYGAAADGTTNDAAAFQTAINAASAAGGGIVVIPPGTYLINTAQTVPSNVMLLGSGKGSTVLKLGTTPPCMFVSSSNISNMQFHNFTIDCNSNGAGINLVGAGTSNIHLRDMIIKNAANSHSLSLCWPVAIGGITGAASGSFGSNITIENCDIGNNASFYESCIVLNSQDVRISNNRFHDITGTYGGGLALYAYCRNVAIAGNSFTNCGGSGGFDCYLQQSDTISYSHNTHFRSNATNNVGISILQCVNLVIEACTFVDTQHVSTAIFFGDITDAGGTTFNGNATLYQYTHNVLIKGCSAYGHFVGYQLYSSPNPSPGIHAQGAVNLMTDITLDDCAVSNMPASGIGFQVGGVTVQSLQRIELRNCRVNGDSAHAGGAGVFVIGNAGFASTTLTQIITANANVQQAVTSAATPTGLVVGQWVSVDTAGTQEDVCVTAVSPGVGFTAAFSKSHSSGVAVAQSATIAANNGIGGSGSNGGVTIAGGRISPAVGSASTAAIAIKAASQVKIDNVDMTGCSAPISLLSSGSYNRARNNLGYNPVGWLSTPSMPSTTVAFTNNFGLDCTVYITGGTVTVIAIAGVGTGLTSGQFFVPAGKAVTLTYSVAPSWGWYAN